MHDMLHFVILYTISFFLILKGQNRQHSGQNIQNRKKTKEIQPVRPTEVCGKV